MAEAEGLMPQQIVAVGRMRRAESGDAAYALGESVPAAVRLYAAGAVDFNHSNFQAAVKRFQAVLDLTQEEARPRAVWAAFMLGRSEAKLDHAEEAATAFQTAREWAGRGASDSQGLAVASYGEEARLHILRALALVPENDASMDPETRRLYADEIGKSMRLYADQAAYGSIYGASSLGFVASHVLETADRIAAVLDDSFVARVLFAYEDAKGPMENYPIYQDISDEERNPPIVETLLIAAIKAHGIAGLPDLDRIAALLYEDGQFDDAFALADKVDTPLAYWLRAKQSVRQGDLPAAAENYRRAIAAFPTAQGVTALPLRRRQRLVAESGSVAVGRAEFQRALELFAASGYRDEAVYLAERILTIEELQTFLASAAGRPPAVDDYIPILLRDLLARRLMRAGRFDEALSAFASSFSQERARDYVTALRAGAGHGTSVARAEALFEAARIAKTYGPSILGAEAGFYGSAPDPAVTGLFTTQEEIDRYQKNTPATGYSDLAANEAERAASLLPARSQAFAAVLCHVTNWTIADEGRHSTSLVGGPMTHALYARYVKEGAIVPFATHFGHDCPPPDFAAAARFDSEQWNRALHRLLHRRLTYAVIAGTLALIAGGTFLFVRRRRAQLASR